MVSKGEIELIVDYALENESNLEIALKIAFAFNEIRKKIIIDFLDALENALRESLDNEWTIQNNLKKDVFAKWKGCYIAKKKWQDICLIGIESDSSDAKNFFVTVRKNKEQIPEAIGGGKLKNLLDKEYRPGSGGEQWIYWKYFEGIYRNWDEEVLIKMSFKKDEIVRYFKEQILRIKDIATPVIDEAVKSM